MKDKVLTQLDEVRGRIDALFKYNPFRINDKAIASTDIDRMEKSLRWVVERLSTIVTIDRQDAQIALNQISHILDGKE